MATLYSERGRISKYVWNSVIASHTGGDCLDRRSSGVGLHGFAEGAHTKIARRIIAFRICYERIGIPALLIQVATGLWLAYRMIPDVSRWISFDGPVSSLIGVKLMLLTVTLAFAADARIRIIPRLAEDNLTSLAWHIVPVTVVSVLFVVVGVSFRTGWFY